MTLFELLSRAYFSEECLVLDGGDRLSLRIVETKDRFFPKGKYYRVFILYHLARPVINFEGGADQVIAYLEALAGDSRIQIDANWIITGTSAGIYLFEAIHTKRNASYRRMRNALCTIDTDNGKTFFKPGVEENDRISARVEGLMLKSHEYSIDALLREYRQVFNVLMPKLDATKRLRAARRISPPPVDYPSLK